MFLLDNIEPDGLHHLCQNLLSLYNKDTYLTEFPNIQNIVPVKDDPDVNYSILAASITFHQRENLR
ncbi:DUF6119 family protein [Legionella drancourtii]|uniref:DUF6119 family protein n=1 Tax=Legionella drancourtii TaxID=168933 RepID=UPI00389960D6